MQYPQIYEVPKFVCKKQSRRQHQPCSPASAPTTYSTLARHHVAEMDRTGNRAKLSGCSSVFTTHSLRRPVSSMKLWQAAASTTPERSSPGLKD
ncbi:hypothetical protein M3J09_009588 [Ascochyta lentis]